MTKLVVKKTDGLPTPRQNAKRGMSGTLNLRSGGGHYHVSAHKRSEEFITFLDMLLAAHSCLQLVYLPTYAGYRLNPMEKVWWQLKRTVAANRNFTDLAQLEATVRKCLCAFHPDALLRLRNCEVTRLAQRTLITPSETSAS